MDGFVSAAPRARNYFEHLTLNEPAVVLPIIQQHFGLDAADTARAVHEFQAACIKLDAEAGR